MSVAVDATPLLGQRSGVGEFVMGLLGGLGRDSEVDAGAFAVSWRRRHSAQEQLPGGITFIDRPLPARPVHLSWRVTSLPPFEWVARGYEVVHGTNFVVPPTRTMGKVVTVHDLTFLHYPRYCHPSVLRYGSLLNMALSQGAFVHTPSAYVRDEVIEAFSLDSGRVYAVPHGIPVGFHEGTQDVQVYEKPFILALSTLEPRKGIVDLLRAFAEVASLDQEVELWIAGGKGWGTQEFDEVLAHSPFRRRVRLLGYVDEGTRRWLLKSARVFVYPSHYEGFGFPPLEAMAMGTPVVTTNVGALPEVLGDSAKFVPSRDPVALAGALSEVLSHQEIAQDLRTRGYLRAKSYDWDRCAKGMIDLYKVAVWQR